MASKTHTQVLGVTEVDPKDVDPSLKPDENGILSVNFISIKDATDDEIGMLYNLFPDLAMEYWPEWVKENHPNKIN